MVGWAIQTKEHRSGNVHPIGGGGGDFTWSLDSDAWDGGFPYDSARLSVAADGASILSQVSLGL